MDVTCFVVEAGDEAEVTGTVTVSRHGFAISEDLVTHVVLDEPVPTAPHLVLLDDQPDALWSGLVGQRARVRGTWDGTRLDRARPDAAPRRSTRDRPVVAAPPGFPLLPDELVAVRHEERPLWADGTLVARTEERDEQGLVVHYVSHDVDRVRRQLGPVLAGRLTVTESAWGREVFAARDRWLADVDDVLVYVGETWAPHRYPRTFVGLHHVAKDTARRLVDVPDELLTVHALLTPSGTTLPPRAEDL